MKTMIYLKNNAKVTMTFLLLVITMGFAACSDDVNYTELIEEQVGITGLGASADTYNINDALKSFTTENWRDQDAIYLYTGEGSYKDTEGKKGYELVNLPWLKGDKQTNLPEGFCDDITRDNDWELVFNRCGSRSIANNNFFAVYNKYTGILRFFFYMPGKASAGNDHVWEVRMTDNMAQNTTLRYGVPQDCKISNKKLVGLDGEKTISELIAPWVATQSQDGLITPNVGWWAFDVDLSLYSGKNLNENDNFALQMRSMDVGAISLSSMLAANIDGSIKADIDLLQSQHLGNSAMGFITKAGSIGANIYKISTGVTAQKWGEVFGSGIDIAKSVANMCGVKTEAAHDIQGTFDGTVTLAMTGTISTEGVMQKSTQNRDIVSPTFYLKDFNYDYSPAMGEGIWNLETSPVVYYTNAYVDWKYVYQLWNYDHKTGETGMVSFGDRKSPFGGQSVYERLYDNYSEGSKPYQGHVCYFDPSSIKVILNPNVFTKEEIDNAKVFATCGVRRGVKFGSTENFRKALGLRGSEFGINGNIEYSNRSFGEAPFDALSGTSDKMNFKTGTTYDVEDYDGRKFGIFGRGDNGYILEPQALHSDGGSEWMPAYEVNVTLIVEHNGTPIVYSRTYLPEFKQMNVQDMPSMTPMNVYENLPDYYIESIYQQQRNHVRDIRDWTRYTLQPTAGTRLVYKSSNPFWTSYNYDKPYEAYPNLFDGDPSSKWCCTGKAAKVINDDYVRLHPVVNQSAYDGKTWCWATEFMSNFAISPSKYTLVTANDNSVFPNRRPKEWVLLGKRNINDPWTVIDHQSTSSGGVNSLPTGNLMPRIYFIGGYANNMQYFRFEVLHTYDDDTDTCMQLAEFYFN